MLDVLSPEQKKLIDPKIQQDIIATEIRDIKGPVFAFNPREGNEMLMARVRETEILPDGMFRDCALFNETISATAEQDYLRRKTPLAVYSVTVIGENLEDNPEDNTAWRIMQLNVEQVYSQATMVEAAKQYCKAEKDGTLTDEKSNELIDQLNRAQDKIYPKLDPEIARMALDKITLQDDSSMELLSESTRREWHDFLHEKYDSLFESVYDDHLTGQEDIIGQKALEMTEDFMRKSGLPMADGINDVDGWECILDENTSGFTVDSSRKKVICGKLSMPLGKIGFEKMMMHEVVIHAWRTENGSQTGYGAFQTGLPGYIESEEGLGLLMESLWTRSDPNMLSRDHFRYAALSYASGVYDGIMHNEQETYDFIKQAMDATGFGEKKAELYRHVMRPFRGMPAGCRMRSNASYLSGKISTASYIEEQYLSGVSVEETFKLLVSGAIDHTNPEHVLLMKSTLETLEAKKS